MSLKQNQSVFVFFSYEKRDKSLRDRLEEHLSVLRYRGLITTWHDRQILAGEDQLQQIDRSLEKAQIILLLISANFMASDYCYGREMQQALLLHDQKKAAVVPILLRPVLAKNAPFSRLAVLPTNGKPITRWRDRDSAFVDVAENIEKIVEHYLQNEQQQKGPVTRSAPDPSDQPWNETIFSMPYRTYSDIPTTPSMQDLPQNQYDDPYSRTVLPAEARELAEQQNKRAYYLRNVAVYQQAVRSNPQDGAAWRGLGNSHYALAAYAEAREDFEHAIRCQPTPSAYAGAGNACAKLARYAEAIARYRQALQLDPSVTLNYSDFIHALQATGNINEAAQMQVRAEQLGYFDEEEE